MRVIQSLRDAFQYKSKMLDRSDQDGRPTPYQFWSSIGNPRFVVAPMVNQSEAAFRMLTRNYGAELTYTPMLHSRCFVEEPKYRERFLDVCEDDFPVIVQFAANSPSTALKATEFLDPGVVSAVDLNCGCPQRIAQDGNYGAYLLEQPDLICDILRAMNQSVIPVTCKIRLQNDLQKTLNLCYQIQETRCVALTIHGRTKEQRGQRTGPPDMDAIRIIKQRMDIPVIANGGIMTYDDAILCLKATGVDAVMTAEAILENPSIFSGKHVCKYQLSKQYLELTKQYPTSSNIIRAHLFHMLHDVLRHNPSKQRELSKSCDGGFIHFVEGLKTELEEAREPNMSWYMRHQISEEGLKESNNGFEESLDACAMERLFSY